VDRLYIHFFFLGRNGDNHQKYNRIRVKIQEQDSSHFSYRETLKISIRTWTSDIISTKGRGIILHIPQIIENKVYIRTIIIILMPLLIFQKCFIQMELKSNIIFYKSNTFSEYGIRIMHDIISCNNIYIYISYSHTIYKKITYLTI